MAVMLSLCDESTIMCRPWVEAGYHAIAVDVAHPKGSTMVDGVERVGADVRYWLPPRDEYVFVAAFPPCDNLAVSGSAHWKDKGIRGLIDALEVVERCRAICEWSGAPWLLENPRSTLATYWRAADYLFHPYEFGGYRGGDGDGYYKETFIWCGGGLLWPRKLPVAVANARKVLNAPNSRQRARLRSLTPAGFARAIFEAQTGVNVDATQHRLWG